MIGGLLIKAGIPHSLVLKKNVGVYPLVGNGRASRYVLAKEKLKLDPKAYEQVSKEFLPASTTEFPARVKRPLFSAMDCTKFKGAFDLAVPGLGAVPCACHAAKR